MENSQRQRKAVQGVRPLRPRSPQAARSPQNQTGYVFRGPNRNYRELAQALLPYLEQIEAASGSTWETDIIIWFAEEWDGESEPGIKRISKLWEKVGKYT